MILFCFCLPDSSVSHHDQCTSSPDSRQRHALKWSSNTSSRPVLSLGPWYGSKSRVRSVSSSLPWDQQEWYLRWWVYTCVSNSSHWNGRPSRPHACRDWMFFPARSLLWWPIQNPRTELRSSREQVNREQRSFSISTSCFSMELWESNQLGHQGDYMYKLFC